MGDVFFVAIWSDVGDKHGGICVCDVYHELNGNRVCFFCKKKLTCGENLKLLNDSMRFSNSFVVEDFFDVCFVEEDLSDRNCLEKRIFVRLVSCTFFLNLI